jgi:nitrate reductase gamma subunit
VSTSETVRGTDTAGALPPAIDAPSQLGRAVVGLGVGVLAGAVARSRSDSYGAHESSVLRVTAHATVPFFVAASMLTDRALPLAAIPFRSGFLGAHLVHMREIARLVRNHGTRELMIRAELAGGAPLYGLVALQAALLTRIGSGRATRLTRRIDTQLLHIYCLAIASGLVRYRRPLPVYVGLATLLASGLASRRRSR